MDLRSANPYWLLKNGIQNVFPSLKHNLTKEVVIIGSGISGCLVARSLHKAGLDVAVIDRRHAGMGSTVACTALLQYEIDTPLHKLKDRVGEKDAVTSYRLCLEAIDAIESIYKELPASKAEFERKASFQYASFKKHVPGLQQEFNMRKHYGFEVEWLEEKDIEQLYGFKAPAGILSAAGAQMNAYAFTNDVLQHLYKNGVSVFDHTPVTNIHHHKNRIELKTETGHTIQCKQLVIACGYESQNYIPFKVCDFNSTYAIISEPLADEVLWHKQSLVWETSQPYIYLRSTPDNRILIGGKDVPWRNPQKRDALLNSKATALEKKFNSLFPAIPFYTDFKWAGTFASTKDGLPFIGSVRQRSNTFFALGFGGNGITFSMMAADMLRDQVTGRNNKYADIFRFGR